MTDPAAPRPDPEPADQPAEAAAGSPSSSSEPGFSRCDEEETRGLLRALVVLLGLLPKNAISRIAGRLAGLALPGPLQRAEIRLFAWLVGVDLDEARDPVEAFDSLQQFFTRALRPGARPIEGDEQTIVSPCDGAWGESGRIREGTLVQVKGRRYGVAELLADPTLAPAYEGGWYATFYLSPRDYHRFHTPLSGRFVRLDHRPGALWPVNSIGLEGVDGLFARNERICAYLRPDAVAMDVVTGEAGPADVGQGAVALVAVGATMVGSVRVSFDEMSTNVRDASAETRLLGLRAPHFARGAEWGHFEFGSTIVMLLPKAGYALDLKPLGAPLRQGEAIGRVGTEEAAD